MKNVTHLKILLISLNQHISNELKTLHIQSELYLMRRLCVWVCWYWLAVMVNKKKEKKSSLLNTIIIQSHSEN